MIIVTDREEIILDPEMSLLDKIGVMARVCYRTEIKEGQDERAINERIIKKCIKEGHESVLEHGVISLFLNPKPNKDTAEWSKELGLTRNVSILTLYNGVRTDAMNKYSEEFRDIDMTKVIRARRGEDGKDKLPLPSPVIIADVRAWRQIVREKFLAATSHNGDRFQIALVCKMLNEFYNIENGGSVMFQDLYDSATEVINLPDVKQVIFNTDKIIEGTELTIKQVSDMFFKEPDTVIAAKASPTASLSVIFTTERAMTHQLVRHRKNVAYSQESQRYVNYDKKGYRVIHLTADPSKYPEDFFEDLKLGKVRSTSEAYKEWYKAMEDAFQHYHNLLHIYDDENGKSDLVLPPETCRGVMPNDAATRIGVTWMGIAGFANLLYWRLDSHAQYSIRASIARVLFKMATTHHPFLMTVPCHATIGWLEKLKEQPHLVPDMEALDKAINEFKSLNQEIDRLRGEIVKNAQQPAQQ